MAERYRFGLFEFESASGELRREGEPVRLEAQPAQVLRMLLAHAGDVVTREELQRAVWGADTFVDFDRGLNYCIAQIRAALQDSAQSPLFVRTLPKRGYQFIAPVSAVDASQPGCAVLEPRPSAARPASRLLWILGGVAALALVTFHPWTGRSSAGVPFTIAVVRFDNESGQQDLDKFADGLTDSVVADLTAAGAGRFDVIGNAAILRKPREGRDLVAIGSALRAHYVIIGQVQRNVAGDVRVLAHLIRLPEQAHIWVTRADFRMDDPLRRESDISKRVVSEFTSHLDREPRPSGALHVPVSN